MHQREVWGTVELVLQRSPHPIVWLARVAIAHVCPTPDMFSQQCRMLAQNATRTFGRTASSALLGHNITSVDFFRTLCKEIVQARLVIRRYGKFVYRRYLGAAEEFLHFRSAKQAQSLRSSPAVSVYVRRACVTINVGVCGCCVRCCPRVGAGKR